MPVCRVKLTPGGIDGRMGRQGMIFYFTATGNSKFIAEKISAETGDQLKNIAECIQADSFSFDLAGGESVGIVSPVYFRGVPMIVAEFVQKLSISGKPGAYSYVVLNCGGTAGKAEKFIPPAFRPDAVFDVATVSNYVPMYHMDGEEDIERRLDGAEREIDEIVQHIKGGDRGVFARCRGRFPGLVSSLSYPIYRHGRKTGKFTVNGNCTGCGICESVCPRQVIRLENGRPVWTLPRCEICLGCLHRCPSSAINYGKKSAENGRYLNPRVSL